MKCLSPFELEPKLASTFRRLTLHLDVLPGAAAADDPDPDTGVDVVLGAADVDDELCDWDPELGAAAGGGGALFAGTDEGKAGAGPSAGVITPTAEARFEIAGPG